MSLCKLIMCLLVFVGIVPLVNAQVPTLAFPGAEGFGRYAQGGRGGNVLEVTNLNASGPGSLRNALEASGPRTIVFRVSGNIVWNETVSVSNPFLTVAGQTAPGEGITLKGTIMLKTSHVIIRHLRIRPAIAAGHPDAMTIYASPNPINNIILDHVSLSWGQDEVLGMTGNITDMSIQWSILAEGLPGSKNGMGFLQNGGSNFSIHHNLFIHNKDRNPLLKSGNIDVVNNVIYNRGNAGTTLFPKEGKIKANIVNNYYQPGVNTINQAPIRLMGNQPYHNGSSAYLKGNIDTVFRPDNSRPELDVVRFTSGPPNLEIAGARFSYPQITTVDAFQAKTEVLERSGATFPIRDSVDSRIVNDVMNETGSAISDPAQVGGWPNLAHGISPQDLDHDGMPDSWELANGLNPNSPADGTQDINNDGYTNLEDYLNSIVTSADPENGSPLPPTGLTFVN